MVFWFSIQLQTFSKIARKALFTVNPMVSWALVYFYHITKKYHVEHRKLVGRSDSLTKPYVGLHEHIDKAPNQVSQHPPMRKSTDRGNHGLSCDVLTLDYITIFPQIFIFSWSKYLFCVVVGTKGLTLCVNRENLHFFEEFMLLCALTTPDSSF